MKETVSTTDIVLAAYLKIEGYRLKEITKDLKRGMFVFSDVETADVLEFNLGNALVEPNALNAAIKALTTSVKRIL